jgi:enamine deaminase RidA (YjgF/YER057c/UK114 family)
MNAEGQPMHAGDMRAQVKLALDNVETVLSQAGYHWSDVVRLNFYAIDVDQLFACFDTVGARLGAAGCKAPGTLLGVTRLAFPELLVEIEATAMK